MKIFDTMLLDVVLITFPLIVYLLYLAYTKTFNKKENDLLFAVTVFSVLYLILKYTTPLYQDIPFLIINISLILSYVKKSNLSIITVSIIMIAYYYNFYQNYLLIIILEYLIYYLLYLKLSKKLTVNNLILTFAILKTTFTVIILYILNSKLPSHLLETVISGIFLYIISLLITHL